MHGQQDYTEMHGQQDYTKMHGQQDYTEMHGQQNIKTTMQMIIWSVRAVCSEIFFNFDSIHRNIILFYKGVTQGCTHFLKI